MDLLQVLFAVVLIISLARIEYKIAGVFYTPFILIACPYAVIFFVQWYSIQLYNLSSFNILFFPYMLMHLFVIWMVDMVYFINLKKHTYIVAPLKGDSPKLRSVAKQNIRAGKIIGFCGIILSAYLVLRFVKDAKSLSMIGKIVQEDFQLEYSSGFNFYARLVCMISSVYFFSFFDKTQKKYLLFGIICLVPNILTFVKGTVFICIVAGVLGNTIIHKRKLNMKIIAIIGITGVLVFFGIYLVEICIWNPSKFVQKETYEYIFAKLNFYLISGVQGFNEQLNLGKDFVNSGQNPVFAPIVNVLAKTGLISRVDTISNEWTTLGSITNYGIAKTNTYSFIGVLVLYLGNFISILWEIMIAIVEVFFFSLMVQQKKIEYFILYVTFVSVYILGWFNYYLMLTFWLYLLIMLVALAAFTRVFRYKFIIKRASFAKLCAFLFLKKRI